MLIEDVSKMSSLALLAQLTTGQQSDFNCFVERKNGLYGFLLPSSIEKSIENSKIF